MRRRELIAILGSTAAWPLAARGQQARVPTIGVLLVGNLEPFWSQFREGLRDFGYIDGQNIRIEFRSGEGKLHVLPDLAADLVRLRVDLIVASETPAVQAAKQATSTIPIVMAPSGDPVGTGQVEVLPNRGATSLDCPQRPQSLPEKAWNSSASYCRPLTEWRRLRIPQTRLPIRFLNRSTCRQGARN